MKIEFEWDEGNKHKSLTKHCVGNIEAESVFSDKNRIVLPSNSKFGEKRYLCIGISNKQNLITNVYCFRNGKVRIISSRKANPKEKKEYGY